MRKLAASLLVSLIALPVVPQQQTFFTETIEVRVINVDVIVTGKDGRPATGLTKEDFEVYEDGKLQTITNFLEMRGEDLKPAAVSPSAPAQPASASAPPADSRARNVVILLDTTTIPPFTRDRIFKPMETFLQRTMRAGDHVMLISWNPGLRVELPFTNDTSAAAKTLQRLAGTQTTATVAAREFRLAREEIQNLIGDAAMNKDVAGNPEKPDISNGILSAQDYAIKVSFEQSQRLEAAKSVIASMRGLGGRNALVILTNQLSTSPAFPIFAFLDSLRDKFENSSTFNPYIEAKRFEQPSLVTEIAAAANSSGVTLYPISAAGAAVDFETLSAENLAQEFGSPTRFVEHADANLVTLQQMAGATGGKALTGSNNFDLAFNTLTQDLTSYYSLGYHTEGQQKDAVRSISVKLRKKGYSVRARESFVEKSLISEMQDAVAANLIYPIARNDLNITIGKPDPATLSAAAQVVPVTIKIPTSSLTLIPDGTDLVGQFSSYTAFMRRDGKVSEVKRQQHQLRFPADSLKRRKEITVKYDLTVDERTENVSVGIMDDTSHATGFVTMPIGS